MILSINKRKIEKVQNFTKIEINSKDARIEPIKNTENKNYIVLNNCKFKVGNAEETLDTITFYLVRDMEYLIEVFQNEKQDDHATNAKGFIKGKDLILEIQKAQEQ